jgi:hypothetical protein
MHTLHTYRHAYNEVCRVASIVPTPDSESEPTNRNRSETDAKSQKRALQTTGQMTNNKLSSFQILDQDRHTRESGQISGSKLPPVLTSQSQRDALVQISSMYVKTPGQNNGQNNSATDKRFLPPIADKNIGQNNGQNSVPITEEEFKEGRDFGSDGEVVVSSPGDDEGGDEDKFMIADFVTMQVCVLCICMYLSMH